MLTPVTEEQFDELMEAAQRRFPDTITQRKVDNNIDYIFAGLVIIGRYYVSYFDINSDETGCCDHEYDFESMEKLKCAT